MSTIKWHHQTERWVQSNLLRHSLLCHFSLETNTKISWELGNLFSNFRAFTGVRWIWGVYQTANKAVMSECLTVLIVLVDSEYKTMSTIKIFDVITASAKTSRTIKPYDITAVFAIFLETNIKISWDLYTLISNFSAFTGVRWIWGVYHRMWTQPVTHCQFLRAMSVIYLSSALVTARKKHIGWKDYKQGQLVSHRPPQQTSLPVLCISTSDAKQAPGVAANGE